MNDYGRQLVLDMAFDDALGATSRAIREEGLQVIARVDVRDHFWRELRQGFRRGFLVQAWSPDLALQALRTNLEIVAAFPTSFAVCEVADGKTMVVVKEGLASIAADTGRRPSVPGLSAIVDQETARVARVLERLRQLQASRGTPAHPAIP